MPAYVASQTFTLDDQVSAGAAAATAALGKMADAADAASASTDTLNATVTKAGPSAASLANSLDPASKAAKALADAQATLASRTASLNAGLATGTITQAQFEGATATLTARVRTAQAAFDQLGTSSSAATKQISGITDANAEAAVSAETAGAAHAGFYREIVILGHEAITGNFSRIPGSLLVLAERSGNLESGMKAVVSAVTSTAGIFALAGVAGVAAFTAIAVVTDNAANKLLNLQNQLRATHDDYQNQALLVSGAATGAAQTTPGLSRADALTAGSVLDTQAFTGTQAQLQSLITLANDMGKAFSETAEKAATTLADAMTAPGAAAEKLVGHLASMNQSLADSIKLQEESGDKAGAFGRVVDALAEQVGGASENISPLRKALVDLENVFDETGAKGQRTGEGIGSAFANAATYIIAAVTAVLNGIKQLHDYLGGVLPWAQGYGTQPSGPDLSAQFHEAGAAGQITSIGQSLGLSGSQIELAQAVALQESGGAQNFANGSVQRSSAGALGIMQVLPSTAAQYGQDPSTEAGSISAGEQQLVHLWNKYGGNETLVSIAYNMGEGATDKWIAAGSQPGGLPTETLNYAVAVGQRLTGTATAGTATAGAGVTNTDPGVVDQALTKAGSSLGASRQDVQATIELYVKAEAAIRATGDTSQKAADDFARIDTALQAARLSASNLLDPLSKVVLQLNSQITDQDALAAAYGKGTEAVAEVTARNQGYAAALAAVGQQSPLLGTATDALTAKYLDLAKAQGAVAVAAQTAQNGDTLEYINAETSAVGLSDSARQELLDHLKAEQELRAKLVPELSAEGQAYLASADAVSRSTAALQQQQQTLGTIEQLSTQVFDQVGSAITNAFAQGGKSALDFGALAKSVMASVLQEVLKLGALNPVLNSLFGGSRTTLDQVGGLLNGGTFDGSSTTLGSVDIQSGLSNVIPPLNVNGDTGAITSGSVSATGSGLFGSIGSAFSTPLWTGASGAGVTAGGLLGGVGLGAGAGSLLNGLIGGNSTGGTLGSTGGGLIGAAIGSIIPGVGTLIGGLVGGIAGGLLGGLFGGKPSDKTEWSYQDFGTGKVTSGGSTGAEASSQNSQAAANLAGQAYGAESSIATDFGLPALLSGITAKVGSRDGVFLQANDYPNQKYTGADTAAGAATVLNESVAGLIKDFGTGLDATTASILSKIDYSASTATQQVQALADALTGGKLDATQQSVVGTLNQEAPSQEITDLGFIKNTYEPATLAAQNPGSVATQTKALQDSYNAIIAHATTLGLATDTLVAGEAEQIQKLSDSANSQVAQITAGLTSSAQLLSGDKLGSALTTFDANAATQRDNLTNTLTGLFGDAYKASAAYASQMGQLNDVLAGQRQQLIEQQTAAYQSADDSTRSTYAGIVAAQGKAYGVIGNDGTLAGSQYQASQNEAADLFNFDAQASVAADSFSAQLVSTYGQSYTTTADYASNMAQLESSLAAQRLAIQAQYNQAALAQTDQAAQAAAGVVSGLTQYVQSIQTGSVSPLNAQSQYQLAQTQYQADLAKAQGGDATSLSALQGYASTFLSASQNLYGSGASYASDYGTVVQSLSTIAATSSDALTNSFLAEQFTTQTQVLSDKLDELNATTKAVQLELQMQSMAPA